MGEYFCKIFNTNTQNLSLCMTLTLRSTSMVRVLVTCQTYTSICFGQKCPRIVALDQTKQYGSRSPSIPECICCLTAFAFLRLFSLSLLDLGLSSSSSSSGLSFSGSGGSGNFTTHCINWRANAVTICIDSSAFNLNQRYEQKYTFNYHNYT